LQHFSSSLAKNTKTNKTKTNKQTQTKQANRQTKTKAGQTFVAAVRGMNLIQLTLLS